MLDEVCAFAAEFERSTARNRLIAKMSRARHRCHGEVLQFGGHSVEVAYNGPDGLAKAREFKPEIVLCDIGLPGMDGYQVARAFQADQALKGVFLVALSGYALPDDLQRAWEAGFERHLAKPSSLEKLEELLADTQATGRT